MAQVGIHHASRKLTPDDVRSIRAAPPEVTNLQLGAAYGVSGVAAWKARTRRTWAHIDPIPASKETEA